MMITKNSKPSSRFSPTSPPPSSSSSSMISLNRSMKMIWVVYGVMLLIMIIFLIMSVNPLQKPSFTKGSPSPFDNKLVVGRYKRSYNIWNTIASDPMFVILTKTLMEINSTAAVNSTKEKGSQEIAEAYQNLDRYVKENLKFPENTRITLMYNDGIVFYDSVLQMSDVFFMKDGLPRPVNLYTLGSPLKDHNMLPEVANCVVITDSSDNRLSGMMLSDPFYRKLANEGYGFIERISSTYNRPYNYMAHIITLDTDPATGFINTITMRIGSPITPDNL